MADLKRLNQDQYDHYWEQGYVVVPGVLSDDEMAFYKARARAIAHGEFPPEAKSRIMRDVRIAKGVIPTPDDPEDGLWKLMNPDRFNADFANFMKTPAMLDAVEDIVGPDIIGFLTMVIYKPPGVADAVHPFHQDAFYFPFGPHDRVVACWLPLDDADADNGGLVVVPGSHKGEVERHETPEGLNNAGNFAIPDAEARGRAVELSVKAGDLVLFHSRTWHKTLGNPSGRPRRVLTMHAANAGCEMTAPASTVAEFGMTLVRGKLHEGGLEAGANSDLAFRTHEMDSFANEVRLP